MMMHIMRRRWWPVLWLTVMLPGSSQTLTRQNLASILGFENNTQAGVFPVGWVGGPADTIFTDDHFVHSGKYSARIERTASSSGTFSTLTQAIPVDFAGKTVEWRGFIKTENVSDAVALWLREDGDGGSVEAFATMQGLGIKGTTDWKQYSITLPWNEQAQRLYFGFLLAGTGKGWVDDLEMLVDGQPVAQAPNRITTILDTDHEFDDGSGISLTALSDVQISNLATLAKVWGFLKYHHPAITSGKHHWDYDLFRIMPQVVAAIDRTSAIATLSTWIANLGSVAECTNCATLNTSDLALNTNIDWISDTSTLGGDFSQTLASIYGNRTPQSTQFYVSLVQGVGNPSFDHELPYPRLKVPDAGYQLLALFRFWNMVQYFYPNRDVMPDDPANQPHYWDEVLAESIPLIALASDSLSYQEELIRFIARIHDTHANLWSSIAARPPMGSCYLPVDVRFVEGNPVVLRYTSMTAGPTSGLMPGDVIQQLDGIAVSDLVAQWTPLYADSNQAARMRDIGEYMLRGPCGAASVVVQRADQTLSITPARMPTAALDFGATYTHDLPGATFQMLSPDVAYLKLSSVKAADSVKYIQSAAGTKGLIIDIRNYPSEFVVFSLGSLLVSQPVDFVRFTAGDITNPSAFHWALPLGLTPLQPHYRGKVVILVDEVTQSQAEYTTMAFRTAPGAIVIGSTTAGADGNVSTVLLPGGLSSYISGIGVFYPDKTPTQRVGIVPDIVVTPTLAGIQAGRDELIEEAIRQITQAGPLAGQERDRTNGMRNGQD
jgi:C-terminal processing protease CtpA/Prc